MFAYGAMLANKAPFTRGLLQCGRGRQVKPVMLASSLPPGAQASGPFAAYHRLLTVASDSQLEELPPQMLVQMLRAATKELTSVRQELATLKDSPTPNKRQYRVVPPFVQDRVGEDMYDRVAVVTAKWEPMPVVEPNPWYTLLQGLSDGKSITWDDTVSTFILTDDDYGKNCVVMSCVLWLYRLACLWAIDVDFKYDRYKAVWGTALRHKATGGFMLFGEHKAGILMSYYYGKGSSEKAEMDADVLELVNLLVDPQCPHPYDGTVAGSVA